MAEQVQELDESELISRFLPLLPFGAQTQVGPGDDAAVVATPDGRVVVTTDVLVQDRHFRLEWGSGVDVGWRAAAQNLADVAAMGAVPTGVVVSLVLPGDLPVDWVLDLARGLAQCCGPDVGVVGGDLSSGPQVVVAVTAFGDLAGREAVLRSGARVGDVVACSGRLGWSAAGLAALETGCGAEHELMVSAYRRPEPPVADGAVAAAAGATAMLDVSDGLLRDAARIARASGVGIDLDSAALVDEEVAAAAAALAVDARSLALTGGEDHALLATFPGQLPDGFRPIGRVTDRCGAVTVDDADPQVTSTGWDHFRR